MVDSPGKPRRAGTFGDRNEDRSHRPAAVPEQVDDEDYTGRYEGEELREARAKRPTDKRLAKLETDRDDIRKDVNSIKVDVGKIGSAVDTLLKIGTAEAEARQARERAEALKLEADRTHELALQKLRGTNWTKIIKAVGAALAIAGAAILGAIVGHS